MEKTDDSEEMDICVCVSCLRSNSEKACRGWMNCVSLNDQKKKNERLKSKELIPDILEWYDCIFRGETSLSEFVLNG